MFFLAYYGKYLSVELIQVFSPQREYGLETIFLSHLHRSIAVYTDKSVIWLDVFVLLQGIIVFLCKPSAKYYRTVLIVCVILLLVDIFIFTILRGSIIITASVFLILLLFVCTHAWAHVAKSKYDVEFYRWNFEYAMKLIKYGLTIAAIGVAVGKFISEGNNETSYGFKTTFFYLSLIGLCGVGLFAAFVVVPLYREISNAYRRKNAFAQDFVL